MSTNPMIKKLQNDVEIIDKKIAKLESYKQELAILKKQRKQNLILIEKYKKISSVNQNQNHLSGKHYQENVSNEQTSLIN